MSRLGKKLEDLMAAASFAEEGDSDSARELLRSRKKVLLVLTGRPTDARSCKYAINMAKRTGADVELLIMSAGEATLPVLDSCIKEIRSESVPFSVTRKTGCVRESIISHAGKRGDIICVVIESTEILDSNCSRKEKKLGGVWRRLGCPLALVSERGTA